MKVTEEWLKDQSYKQTDKIFQYAVLPEKIANIEKETSKSEYVVTEDGGEVE